MLRICLTFSVLWLSACAQGEYRIPYRNGVTIEVTADFRNHVNPEERMFDMRGTAPLAFIHAAAAGWVRFIEDGNNQSGGGHNNFIWIEHPAPFCQNEPDRMDWPGKPADYDQTCIPCPRDEFCNEWTFYYHMAPRSVTGTDENSAGLSVGDWVEAGQLLGVESDIGHTSGRHLHWHVAVINPSWTPTLDGDYEDQIGAGGRPELIPIVCTAAGNRVLLRGQTHTAVPCP